MKRVLVTGGAGFIGRHTVELLARKGYETTVIDNLTPQVHGTKTPELPPTAKFVRADIRKKEIMAKLIADADYILHLASAVGVGQSMYQIGEYVDVNANGTAVLLDLLANAKHDVRKLVLASSMSIYGEGAYYCDSCGAYSDNTGIRPFDQLRLAKWESLCSVCKSPLTPKPTRETKILDPSSIYAQTKRYQEEMSLLVGKTYDIPTVALRYFNVYGEGQALSNPYTGACAIFANQILNGQDPKVFEDGKQLRDFVYVKDVAKANLLALESKVTSEAINIGTGSTNSIGTLAELLIKLYGKQNRVKPDITKQCRKGDVRHCYADISKAKKLLGFEPEYELEQGLRSMLTSTKQKGEMRIDAAISELNSKGLFV